MGLHLCDIVSQDDWLVDTWKETKISGSHFQRQEMENTKIPNYSQCPCAIREESAINSKKYNNIFTYFVK